MQGIGAAGKLVDESLSQSFSHKEAQKAQKSEIYD
jgi:hypothetical protein